MYNMYATRHVKQVFNCEQQLANKHVCEQTAADKHPIAIFFLFLDKEI